MNSARLERYRKQLRDTADQSASSAAGLEDQVRTPTGGEGAGGISNAPLHLGDMGSEAYNQELGATLLENETYIRDESLAALKRIDRGTFGRCEHCGTAIPEERLDILPYTRYCAPCAGKLQAGRPVNMNEGRPATWLGEPGHEGLDQTGTPARVVGRDVGHNEKDPHAVGTPGGGTEVGGLAGTNVGTGSPSGANLEEAMGDGTYDASAKANDEEPAPQAFAGSAGGAVGGTPANKRASAGRSTLKNPGSNEAEKVPNPPKERRKKASPKRSKKK